jgi:pilus assembly protein Flp/PilA
LAHSLEHTSIEQFVDYTATNIRNYRHKRAIMKLVRKLFKHEEGATAIEYGLIAALIAVAAITAMTGLGKNLGNTFNKVSNSVKTS